MKVTKHLTGYLNSKKIPFTAISDGVQIDRKYYDYDTFSQLRELGRIYFLDTTFVITY